MKTKLILPILSLLLVMLLGTSTASAAARFAVTTGNWSGPIWAATAGGAAGSAATPTSADTVTINATTPGITVTVDTTAACSSLTLAAAAQPTYSRVVISGANTLTVSGAITINVQTGTGGGSANYVDVANGTLSAGSVSLLGTTSGSRLTELLISTGTATVTGNITSAGTASRIVFSGAGTLNAGGTFLSGSAGTFTASTGTVNFNASATQTIGTYTFNNLTLSGTSAKTVTGATINGTLSIQGTATATGTTPTYGASAVLEYAGSAAQTASTVEFPTTMSADVIINNASGVTFSANNRTLNGNLTLTAGTLAATTRLTMGTGFVINRSEGSLTATTLGGTYDVNYTGNSKTTGPELLGGGLRNVTVALTAGQTLTLDQNRTPDGNLTISSGTFDLSTFTFNRSAAGGTLTVANGASLRIGGTATLPSSYTTYTINANSTSTVEYYGAAQTVGSITYGNLILSGSGTKTLQSGTTALSGSLTLSGTVSATTAANLAISGNLNIGDGTTFTVAANFTLGVTGTTTVGAGTSGTLTLAGTGAKTFTGDVTINPGGVWNETGNSTYSLAGNLQNDGTLTANVGAHTFTAAAKTLSGANPIVIPSVTISGTRTLNGTLTVSTTLAGASILTMGSTGVLNYGGSTAIAPTLTATAVGNTVNYDRAGAQTVKATSYYNLTLSGTSAKTFPAGTTTVNGILSMEGTATATVTGTLTYGAAATLQYSGTSAQTTGTEFPATWSGSGGVVVNNAAGVTLSGAKTINASLTLTSGTLTLPTGTTSTCTSLWFGAVPQLVGTWGSTSSAATHKSGNFPAPSTGILAVGVTGGLFGQSSPTITPNGGGVDVHFFGVKGYTYQVQRSSTSPSSGFSNFGSPITDTTGPFTVNDPSPTSPAYYRLEWQP